VSENQIRGSRLRRAAQTTGAAAGVAAREATARAMLVGGEVAQLVASTRATYHRDAQALFEVTTAMMRSYHQHARIGRIRVPDAAR
jgi:hypothetical protein